MEMIMADLDRANEVCEWMVQDDKVVVQWLGTSDGGRGVGCHQYPAGLGPM